jgi:N-acetylmuramoyl-L-alanine amidase
VVIDSDRNCKYETHLLYEDKKLGHPVRLYLDLFSAQMVSGLKEPISIKDGLLRGVRCGMKNHDTVRIVLDLVARSEYKIFSLENPSRLVIDIFGSKASEKNKKKTEDMAKKPEGREESFGKTPFAVYPLTVVIDPGHGGKDPGAIGRGGLQEKDVVLRVAKKLETKLKEHTNYNIIMTRVNDVFIPLEERTAIANAKKADLFISIHANASFNQERSGVETYFLNYASDEDALNVAARENAATKKNLTDLQIILNDLLLNSKINESSLLAGCVQGSLFKALSERYQKVNNLGVKRGPFYVLIGAEMPSILVEVSFITHKQEEKRLRDEGYIDLIASSIFNGLLRYQSGSKSIAKVN